MTDSESLDCVVIGYNELPFERYEQFLRNYGEEAEAYRDLKFSFVDLGSQKLDYVGLLNYAHRLANGNGNGNGSPSKSEFKSGDIPNLAAAYLTNFLTRKGLQARSINLFQEEKETLIQYLKQDPVCVAITTTFYVVNMPVNEMVEFIRSHNPKVKIVVGGPLVSNHARNFEGGSLTAALEDLGADYYVLEGQGELTLTALITHLKNGWDISGVPNLIYLEGGEVRRTEVFPENNSLDENYIDWQRLSHYEPGRTIQTRTARSCAFNCSFCNYPTRAGKLTLSSIDTVKRELDSIRALGQVENVVFIDDTFNVPLPRFKELCRMMIKENYRFNWFSYFRCSNSDEEAIELMAESGCKGVFLGIESGSPAILKNMNKAATIEKYNQGMEMLHQHGILSFGSFIIGFPGETSETVEETIAFIRETKPTYYRAQMWYCEPGTPIDQHRVKYGISGEGFVWKHATMDSLEAMSHIERMMLSISESEWLPQWSFDFWIIPYLMGKGLSLARFNDFMKNANKMLALEIASVPQRQKLALQKDYLQRLVGALKGWQPQA
jgi:radical SAM PhpK family P-methyltransferase